MPVSTEHRSAAALMARYDDVLIMSTTGQQPCLVVGTPCYGRQVTDLYAGSLLKLQMACFQRDVRLVVRMMGSDALITRARQNIVADFLSTEVATHLLFVDADIGFEPEQVFRLLEFDVDVSAAIYPIKRVDWQKVQACVEAKRTPLESAALSYMIEFAGDRIQVVNGFAKVEYAGTGFLMIKRKVLLSMVEHYPELKYGHDHKHEDKLGGSQWRSALFNCMIDKEKVELHLEQKTSVFASAGLPTWGGEIWADLQSWLTHVGTAVSFQGDIATQFTQAAGAE